MTLQVAISSLSPTEAEVIASGQVERDFTLTETDQDTNQLRLTEYWRSQIGGDAARYVLGLAVNELTSIAARVAVCFARGTVFRKHGDHTAHAYPHHCYDPLCRQCGRRRSRLHAWLQRRNKGAIMSQTQTGIELTKWYPKPASTPEESRSRRDWIVERATKFAKALGTDTVSHDVLDPNSCTTSIRMATIGVPKLADIKSLWHKVAGDGTDVWCCLYPNADSSKVLEWVFAGMEPALLLSGEGRADLRKAYSGARHIRTTGSSYKPLSKEALKEHRQKREDLPCNCPVCGEPLVEIPPEERVAEPIEDIKKRYQHVILTSEYEPLPEPKRVIRKQVFTDKSEQKEQSDAEPRYGPS